MSDRSEGGEGGLRRMLGFGSAVGLGLGSVLGTGVFVSLGVAAGIASSGIVLAVLFAAALATTSGLSSAQLAAAHPTSGGTYEFAHRLIHPFAGLIAGWTFLLAKSASAATAALGCAGYLLHALGLANDERSRVGIGLALVVILTALIAGGARRSSRANLAIVSLTLAALLAFIVFGWVHVESAHLRDRFGPRVLFGAWRSPSELLYATALVFVAYTGFGRVATLGEEVREPERTIPRAIVTVLGMTMALYLGVAMTAIALVGADGFAQATAEWAAPLEVIAEGYNQEAVQHVIGAGAIAAMAGVLLNLLLGLSRVILAMARRGELPGVLAAIDNKAGSPMRSVWAVGVVIGALVLLGDVRMTWSLSAGSVLVYYGLTNWAALKMAEKQRRWPRWVAWVGIFGCFGIALFVDWEVLLLGGVIVLIACGVSKAGSMRKWW